MNDCHRAVSPCLFLLVAQNLINREPNIHAEIDKSHVASNFARTLVRRQPKAYDCYYLYEVSQSVVSVSALQCFPHATPPSRLGMEGVVHSRFRSPLPLCLLQLNLNRVCVYEQSGTCTLVSMVMA